MLTRMVRQTLIITALVVVLAAGGALAYVYTLHKQHGATETNQLTAGGPSVEIPATSTASSSGIPLKPTAGSSTEPIFFTTSTVVGRPQLGAYHNHTYDFRLQFPSTFVFDASPDNYNAQHYVMSLFIPKKKHSGQR